MATSEELLEKLTEDVLGLSTVVKVLISNTNDLSDSNKALKAAQAAAAITTNKSTEIIAKESEKVKELKRALEDAKSTLGSFGKLQQATTRAQEDLADAYARELKGVIGVGKSIKELEKDFAKQLTTLTKVNKQMEVYTKGNTKLVGHIKNISQVMAQAKTHFMAFSAVLGATGFEMGSIVKSGLEYNRTLFQISRTQSAVGNKTEDTAKAMEYVSKATGLSKAQFTSFAQSMTKNFVGVRPSLMQLAQLSKDLGSNGVIAFEDQKQAAEDLMAVQTKFPALYDKMREGIALAAKINEGRGNDKDKERLEVIKATTAQMQLLAGASSADMASAQERYAIITGDQKKLNEATAASQKVDKEFADAKIKMFEEFRPVLISMMKGLAGVAEWVGKNSELIGKMAIGITALKTFGPLLWNGAEAAKAAAAGLGVMRVAATGFTTAFAANPLGLVITGLALAGVAMYKLWSRAKQKKEEEDKSIKVAAQQATRQNEINSLSATGLKTYTEMMDAQKGSLKTEDDIQAAHVEAYAATQKEEQKSKDVYTQLNKARINMAAQVEILEKIKGGFDAIVEASEKYGMTNEKALDSSIAMAKSIADAAGPAAEQAVGLIEAAFKDAKIDFKIDKNKDLSEQVLQAQKALEINQKLIASDKDREQITGAIGLASEAIGNIKKKQGAVADALYKKDEMIQRQSETYNAKYEARLNTERELMEKAQFGMGASVAMLQKQVDLQYKLIQVNQKTISNERSRLGTIKGMTPEIVKQLESATSAGEAQEIVEKNTEATGHQLMYVGEYWGKFQDNSKKVMDSQSKIYELTKEVREGYLDAVREMSSGAGEFEKIIGTQDTGVSQLMDTVDKFTKGGLNSMKLGGKQSQELTAGGVGTEVAGRMTMGGATFMGGAAQTEENKRLFGYQDSQETYRKMQSGEKAGSTVGGAMGAGEDAKNIRPYEEEFKLNKDSTVAAIIEANGRLNGRNMMQGINKGIPAGGNFAKGENTSAASGLALGGALAAAGGAAGAAAGRATPRVQASSKGERLDFDKFQQERAQQQGGTSVNAAMVDNRSAAEKKWGLTATNGRVGGAGQTQGQTEAVKAVVAKAQKPKEKTPLEKLEEQLKQAHENTEKLMKEHGKVTDEIQDTTTMGRAGDFLKTRGSNAATLFGNLFAGKKSERSSFDTTDTQKKDIEERTLQSKIEVSQGQEESLRKQVKKIKEPEMGSDDLFKKRMQEASAKSGIPLMGSDDLFKKRSQQAKEKMDEARKAGQPSSEQVPASDLAQEMQADTGEGNMGIGLPSPISAAAPKAIEKMDWAKFRSANGASGFKGAGKGKGMADISSFGSQFKGKGVGGGMSDKDVSAFFNRPPMGVAPAAPVAPVAPAAQTKVTSSAQAAGTEAKAADQAVALSPEVQQQKEAAFGQGGDASGGGGGGGAVITIKLAEGLQGILDEMKGVVVNMQQAAARR